jgi:hypothetical protein
MQSSIAKAVDYCSENPAGAYAPPRVPSADHVHSQIIILENAYNSDPPQKDNAKLISFTGS